MLKANSIKSSGLKWVWIAFVLLVLDVVSKHWVLVHLDYQQPLEILPFFNLTLAYNKGAAFSMLDAASGWQHWFLGGLALTVAVSILVWLAKLPASNRLQSIALSLILGGAVGNLIDRIRFGYVIDFLDFHLGDWHFAIFNVADSGITVGAIMLILCWGITSK